MPEGEATGGSQVANTEAGEWCCHQPEQDREGASGEVTSALEQESKSPGPMQSKCPCGVRTRSSDVDLDVMLAQSCECVSGAVGAVAQIPGGDHGRRDPRMKGWLVPMMLL